MKLEEKIAAQRKAHGLSQEALAEQLGVSRQAISRWEQGIAQPDARQSGAAQPGLWGHHRLPAPRGL